MSGFDTTENTNKSQPEKAQNKVSNEAQALLDLFHTVKTSTTDAKPVGSSLDFGHAKDIFNDNLFAAHWNPPVEFGGDKMTPGQSNAMTDDSAPTNLTAAQTNALHDILTGTGKVTPEQSKALQDILHAFDGMTQANAISDTLRVSENPTIMPVAGDPTASGNLSGKDFPLEPESQMSTKTGIVPQSSENGVPQSSDNSVPVSAAKFATPSQSSDNGATQNSNPNDTGKSIVGGEQGKQRHQITTSDVQKGGMSIDPTTGDYVPVSGGTGVEQSGLRDCWYEATVAALASTPQGAKTIADSIKTNPDGSYTVTFQGDKDHPVSVTQDDLKDPKISDSAEWAKVMEAALLKHDPDHANNGGWSKDAFKLITGKDPHEEAVHSDGAWWNPFDSGHDSLGDIQNALKDGDAVTVSTKGMSDVYKGPVVWNHEYQVVSVDPNTQSVVLRNPWGENEAGAGPGLPGVGQTKDGVTDLGGGEIKVSYDTFRKDFETVDYEAA